MTEEIKRNNMTSDNDFLNRVLKTIKKYKMLNYSDTVLVAVSGGPDSIALLHFLNSTKDMFNLNIYAFHLNHKIRGEAADKDERFVIEFASKLKIPLFVETYNIPDYAELEKLSIEEAARNIRYLMLEKIAKQIQASRIALGHHADDQIETFLMRMIRGSGLEGLKSIPPVRDIFIRPFIEVSKSEVLAYLNENCLSFRIDASNEDMSYLRNRIRHELIPILNNYNPNFRNVILNTIELVREDQFFIDRKVDEIFSEKGHIKDSMVHYYLDDLKIEPLAVKRRLIRQAIKVVKGNLKGIEFKHIDIIIDNLGNPQFRIDLPGKIAVFIEYGRLVFCSIAEFTTFEIRPLPLKVPGITKINQLGVEIEAEFIDPIDLVFERNGHIAHLDAEKIKGQLFVRTRKPGDIFYPFGMVQEKKLQDFFVDEKVPARERDKVPIVVSGEDIVWVAGYRIDERYKISEETRKVLVLKLKSV